MRVKKIKRKTIEGLIYTLYVARKTGMQLVCIKREVKNGK